MRSEDELLEIVRRRAEELRAARRRRISLVTTLSVSVVLALAVAVAIAPSGDRADRLDVTGQPTTDEALEGRWIPIAYSEVVVPPEGVYVEFGSGESLVGYDGCNTFGARWAVEGDRLLVTDLLAHRMLCRSDRDTRLLDILNDDPSIGTFDDVPGSLKLSSSSGFVAFSPADATTPSSLDESTTTTVSGVAAPSVVTPTTTDPTPPCAAESLTMSAALDRDTYQPGDLIHIGVTLSNSSTSDCWVPTDAGAPCSPNAEMRHFYAGDDNEPKYDGQLGFFQRSSCPARELVPAGGQMTVMVDARFETAAAAGIGVDGPLEFLRAGTWNVNVGWAGLYKPAATATFECPEPGCRKGSYESPQPQ